MGTKGKLKHNRPLIKLKGNIMKDKTQRLTSYISGAGLTVYEIEQYHAASNDWYIVGDCSTDKAYMQGHIDLNNTKVAYQTMLREGKI